MKYPYYTINLLYTSGICNILIVYLHDNIMGYNATYKIKAKKENVIKFCIEIQSKFIFHDYEVYELFKKYFNIPKYKLVIFYSPSLVREGIRYPYYNPKNLKNYIYLYHTFKLKK